MRVACPRSTLLGGSGERGRAALIIPNSRTRDARDEGPLIPKRERSAEHVRVSFNATLIVPQDTKRRSGSAAARVEDLGHYVLANRWWAGMMLTPPSGNTLERTLNVCRPQPYRGRTRCGRGL